MSLYTALAKAIVAADLGDDVVWFEDELPNKDRAYPQVTIDTSFSTKIELKEGYHEKQSVYVSVWFESGDFSTARAAEALSLSMMEAVHNTRSEGVWICSEDRALFQEKDTGLNRWRIIYELQRVTAS